jgi:hypothetical protein
VLLIAETTGDALARAAVLAVPVEVAPDPSVLRRIRTPVLALGVLLVLVALGVELRRLLT